MNPNAAELAYLVFNGKEEEATKLANELIISENRSQCCECKDWTMYPITVNSKIYCESCNSLRIVPFSTSSPSSVPLNLSSVPSTHGASSVPPKVKRVFRKIGIKLDTPNVNHTALYKYASGLPGFKEGAFQAIYRTEPSRDKNVQSREHDEVISRAIKAMGLSLRFGLGGTKKTGPIRFVEIYGTYSDDAQKNEIETKLKKILKSFQRVPQPVAITAIP